MMVKSRSQGRVQIWKDLRSHSEQSHLEVRNRGLIGLCGCQGYKDRIQTWAQTLVSCLPIKCAMYIYDFIVCKTRDLFTYSMTCLLLTTNLKAHFVISNYKRIRMRQRRVPEFVYVRVCAPPSHQVLCIAFCPKAKYENINDALYNSLYQKLSITFVCFYIDNEDDHISFHRYYYKT